MMASHPNWFRVVLFYFILFSAQRGICAESNIADTTDCYVVNEGRAIYTGTKNVTKSGHACLNWSWVLQDTSYMEEDFRSTGMGNYCRDPISLGKPFCGTEFIEHAQTRFGYFSKIEACDIPECIARLTLE